MMLLQQFLPTTSQISSEFFIFQQDSASAHRALEVINFAHNFVKCWAILKHLWKQTQQYICNKIKRPTLGRGSMTK